MPDFHKPRHNISEHPECLLLAESPFLLNEPTQVALVAVLGDDVAVRGFPDNIHTLEHILMLDGLECFYLAFQHFAADGILDALHVDCLDGHGFA